MRLKITFTIIFLCCINNIFASVFFLWDLKIYNATMSDSLRTVDQTYVLTMIDSLRANETVQRIISPVGIGNVYLFDELSCIKAFDVNGAIHSTGNFSEEPYEQFLFNECDSSIYPFGGGDFRFSRVVRQYLPAIIEGGEDKIRELIRLYLNTLDDNDGYYIISSPDDYIQIWEKMKKNRFYMNTYFTDEQMAEDIEEVKNKIKPFEVTQEVSGKMQRWEIVDDEPYLTVKVMSWELFFGKIEQWEYRISEEVFDVHKRNLVMCGKGPFIRLSK